MARVLVIEDNTMFQRVLSRGLEAAGHTPVVTTDGLYGLEQLVQSRPDLVLLDLMLGEEDLQGLEVLVRIRDLHPELPVIIMTGFGTIETAVEAMKRGASEFLQKPFNIEEMIFAIEHALEVADLRQEVGYLRRVHAELQQKEPPVAVSRSMREVLDIARKTAQSSASVILSGESGSGKEVLSRFIHSESPRKQRPFVVIDCASLRPDEIEVELFGRDDEMGKCQLASGGTLVLDDITSLDPHSQGKLLRFIEDGIVPRQGRRAAVAVDLRVIATMGMELDEIDAAMEAGYLRSDLFYRLNQVSLRIPPLRERTDDILPLFEVFLREFVGSAKNCHLEHAAREQLLAHKWLGNVRELRNLVERIALLGDVERIGPEQLFFNFVNHSGGRPVTSHSITATVADIESGEVFDEVVRLLLEESLTRSKGKQAEASRWLGLNRSRFTYRLKQHGINPHDYQAGD